MLQYINGGYVFIIGNSASSSTTETLPTVINAAYIDGVPVELTNVVGNGKVLTYEDGTLTLENISTPPATAAQNTVYAGPTSGSGTAAFRALVSGDLPTVAAAQNLVYAGPTSGSGTAAFRALVAEDLPSEPFQSFVTVNSSQSISGVKTFTSSGAFTNNLSIGAATITNNSINCVSVGDDGVVVTSDSCFAMGHTSNGGVIRAGGNSGCFSFGGADNTGVIDSGGNGSFALGLANDYGRIDTQADGCVALGTAGGVLGNVGNVSARSIGDLARGYVDGGDIIASGGGAIASGAASDTSQVKADNYCALAHGAAYSNRVVKSSGEGGVSLGTTVIGSIINTGMGAMAVGSDVQADSDFSHAIGTGSYTAGITNGQVGNGARASGRYTSAPTAYAQFVDGMVLRARTSNATPTEALGGPSLDRRLILSNTTTWAVKLLVVAACKSTATHAAFELGCCIYRGANAASTTLLGSVTKNVIARSDVGFDVDATADTTNGSLKVTVTGLTGTDVTWAITPFMSEVMFT